MNTAGNSFGRICLCVSILFVLWLLKALTYNFVFWYPAASSEYLYEFRMSRSPGQGRGRKSKKRYMGCEGDQKSCVFALDNICTTARVKNC